MHRVLTLAELEAFDPHAPSSGAERRFLCPLCGEGKPRDAAHRCLCANVTSGLWNCWRCGERGLLGEFRLQSSTERAGERRQRRAKALRGAFALENASSIVSSAKAPQNAAKPPLRAFSEYSRATEIAKSTDSEYSGNAPGEKWCDIFAASRALDEGDKTTAAGRAYLARRGIALEVAQRADVRFVAQWHGRAALLFPFRDLAGEVVAVAGRCLTSGGLDKPAAGPKKRGAFFAPTEKYAPLDAALPAIVLCEAPFDALSLASAGFPALALGGTASPQWLARACGFRKVALAFDADVAGDAAAARLEAHLASFGAGCLRLRPPHGAKDWNEYSGRYGIAALADWLAAALL